MLEAAPQVTWEEHRAVWSWQRDLMEAGRKLSSLVTSNGQNQILGLDMQASAQAKEVRQRQGWREATANEIRVGDCGGDKELDTP